MCACARSPENCVKSYPQVDLDKLIRVGVRDIVIHNGIWGQVYRILKLLLGFAQKKDIDRVTGVISYCKAHFGLLFGRRGRHRKYELS